MQCYQAHRYYGVSGVALCDAGRLAIAASGQIVQLREILLQTNCIFGNIDEGTVPVLDLRDGTVIEESRDIMMWALRAKDPDGWLISIKNSR